MIVKYFFYNLDTDDKHLVVNHPCGFLDEDIGNVQNVFKGNMELSMTKVEFDRVIYLGHKMFENYSEYEDNINEVFDELITKDIQRLIDDDEELYNCGYGYLNCDGDTRFLETPYSKHHLFETEKQSFRMSEFKIIEICDIDVLEIDEDKNIALIKKHNKGTTYEYLHFTKYLGTYNKSYNNDNEKVLKMIKGD